MNCAFPLRTSNFRELTKVNKILCTTQSFLRFFFYHGYPNPKMFQKMEILDQLSLLFEKDPVSKGLYGKQQTQSVDIDCKHRQSGLL